MSLLALAESDLALTLESSADFGKAISLTDPSGNSAVLTGQFGDVYQLAILDGELPIGSDVVHITLRTSSIVAAGLDDPATQQVDGDTPWRITITDITGATRTFKLKMDQHDRTIGVVTAIVERLIDG